MCITWFPSHGARIIPYSPSYFYLLFSPPHHVGVRTKGNIHTYMGVRTKGWCVQHPRCNRRGLARIGREWRDASHQLRHAHANRWLRAPHWPNRCVYWRMCVVAVMLLAVRQIYSCVLYNNVDQNNVEMPAQIADCVFRIGRIGVTQYSTWHSIQHVTAIRCCVEWDVARYTVVHWATSHSDVVSDVVSLNTALMWSHSI